MIKEVNGDLLAAAEDIIAHQVNCFGATGGLAAYIFCRWPAAYEDYRQVTGRLGSHGLQMKMLGHAQLTGQQRDGKMLANLYGQYFPGQDYRPAMLERALRALGDFARSTGKSVALPYGLSCGICGGDWTEVREIIGRTLEDVDATLYRLN